MTTGELLLNIGVLVFVLVSGLGIRPLTSRRFALPIALVVIVGFVFLPSAPIGGNDLDLDVVLGAAGVILGGLAGALMMVRRRASDGGGMTIAGLGYAALWIAVIGARILFAYGSSHWFAPEIDTFSRQHAITGTSAWTAGFVVMAMAMVASRVAVTGLKAAHIPRGTALLATHSSRRRRFS